MHLSFSLTFGNATKLPGEIWDREALRIGAPGSVADNQTDHNSNRRVTVLFCQAVFQEYFFSHFCVCYACMCVMAWWSVVLRS